MAKRMDQRGKQLGLVRRFRGGIVTEDVFHIVPEKGLSHYETYILHLQTSLNTYRFVSTSWLS